MLMSLYVKWVNYYLPRCILSDICTIMKFDDINYKLFMILHGKQVGTDKKSDLS